MKIRKVALAAVPMLCTITTVSADEYPQLTDLPTVYIETENGASVKSKTEYVKATLRYVDATGVTLYDAANIRGRGNSTWGLSEKPYRIKFDEKQRFLGEDRANAKSWTLLANHADKTLIRNAVASYIGTFAGQPFTPAAQFVDLVLNGKYLGSYQISDQIDVRKKRVHITEQKTSVADDPTADITGGYLLEVDGFASSEPVYFTTHQSVTITIKSPDDEIIDTSQIDYIHNYVNAFEDALFSTDFTDPEKGYRPYVDPSTLASWYIASELTANVDCFWSTYMYKEQGDDKLYWGPMWDYDIAFNNCNRAGDVSESLMRDAGFGAALAKKWATRLWKDPWFVQLIADKWQEMVNDGIEQQVIDYIDETAAKVEQSQKLNYDIWPINKRVYNEMVLFDTYAEGIEFLKDFIHTHCAYLTDVLAENTENAGGDTGGDNSSSSSSSSSTTAAEEFVPNPAYFYRIQNCGSGLMADVSKDEKNVELNSPLDSDDPEAVTQRWYFSETDGDGFYRLINASTGTAITDAATWSTTGYPTGTQLTLSAVDEWDDAQQWMFDPLSEDNKYAIVNRLTNLAWNNQGGFTTDGTSVISWTNDEQNSSKPTRQWRPVIDGLRESTEAAERLAGPDYMVTYTPDDAVLHFRTNSPEIFTTDGVVNVHTVSGVLVATKSVAAEVDLSALPSGLYVVSWQMGTLKGSAKFTR